MPRIVENTKDVKQEQIMNHFQKNGFEYTPLENLSPESHYGLIQPHGNTKLMVFNPQRWYQENHKLEGRSLNSVARKICNN